MNFKNAPKNLFTKFPNNEFMKFKRDTWVSFKDKMKAIPLKELFCKMTAKPPCIYDATELAKSGMKIAQMFKKFDEN